MSESHTLARERESERELGEEKVDFTKKKGKYQKRDGEQVKRTSLGEVGASMSGRVDAKVLQEDLKSLGFTSSLAKPEKGKEAGRRKARSKDDRVK